MARAVRLDVILPAVALLFSPLFLFCSRSADQQTPANNGTATYRGIGVVKAVHMASAELTIDHEDIPGYMSAMEMTLPVSETGLIGATKTGDKVEFEMLRDGSILTITKLSKIGEVAIVNGAAIYAANCAACHGAAGEGAKRGIPLTKGHAIDHPEVEHIKQVTDGEKGKMPAFHDKLTPDEIAAVVKHVRDVIQKDVKPEMRGHHH